MRAAAFVVALAMVWGTVAPASSQPSDPAVPVVRIPFPQEDGSLTPYTFELGYSLMTLVYDTLLWRDDKGVPRPWLAQSAETSPDGRRVTIRLAPGARWHDGVAVTAGDVAFTFRFLAQRPHPRFTPQLRAVERVDAVDASTVVIVLRQPSPGFSDQPLADVPILPAHRWQNLARGSQAPAGLPVGSGPYRLVEHVPGQHYRFQANPQYFRGPPAVQTLEVPIINEAEGTIRVLRQHRADVVPVSLPEKAALRVEGLATKVVEGPSYLGTVLMFNLRRPPFDRVEVRQAMAKALELERITTRVGEAVPAERGYLHPESAWASSADLHVFDEGAARSALAGLGLAPIEVVAPDSDPIKLEASRQVAFALERAGVKAVSKAMPRAEFSKAVGEDGSAPSFQAAIYVAPPLASYDPDFLGRLFGSAATGGNFNYSGYRSATFDAAAERVATTPDPKARQGAVDDALRLLANDAPVVPLFFATGVFAYRPSTYSGWVFVKGSGILDKQSFLPTLQGEKRPSPGVEAPDDGGGFPFGLLSLGLLAIGLGMAVVLCVLTLQRRRPVNRLRELR